MELKNNHLEEAERIVLGIALHSPNALPEIVANLNIDDFHIGSHKIIFEQIANIFFDGGEISPRIIGLELEKKNKLSQVGGADKIAEITNTFFTDEEVEKYIELIRVASKARKFDDLLVKTQEKRKSDAEFHQVLQDVQSRLLEIDLDSRKVEITDLSKNIDKVIEKIKELETFPSSLTGVDTGFKRLNEITNGWQKSDLIILAARPSMGKTAFALNLAYNAAKVSEAVVIFSIEMPAEQLTQRLLSTTTGIDSNKLRTGKGLQKDEWSKINMAKDRLERMKVFIDDTPGINVQQIQSKLFKLKRDHDVKICIIDYLQLITSLHSNGADRQNEISVISRQLKKIARDTEIPIVCLSQLSRSVEKREDKRPIMSDLRDSGAIEQDADLITFLYRDDYYKHNDDMEGNPISQTELIIAKHRNGATGNIRLNFDKKHGRFLDSE